jgi:hypothetical protein
MAMQATGSKQQTNGAVASHQPRPLDRQALPFEAVLDPAGNRLLRFVEKSSDGQDMPYLLDCGPAELLGRQYLGRDMLVARRILDLMVMCRELESERQGWLAERDQLLEKVRLAEGVAAQYQSSASQKARADVKRRQEG